MSGEYSSNVVFHPSHLYRAKGLKSYTNASPKKTPTKNKANKTPALLDPARLRPPQLISGERSGGEQGRVNMSLGIQPQQRGRRRTDAENEDDDPFNRIDSLENI